MSADQYIDWLEGFPSRGKLDAEFAIVGISPSTKRPQHRRLEPFGASSFTIIQNLRVETKQSLYVTNLVKTPYAPGKVPGVGDVRKWTPVLYDELKMIRPKRILALGALPAKALAGEYGYSDLTEDHGTFFWNSELEAWIVPTFHFSAGMRAPQYQAFIGRDLNRWLELPDPDRSSSGYRLLNDISELDLPIGCTVALDIETRGLEYSKEIISIGLVNLDDTDDIAQIIMSPTRDDIRELGRQLKINRCEVVGHNLQFDLRFLLHHSGWSWPRIVPHDTMIMAHLAGEEKLSLKHLTTFHTNRPGSRMGGTVEDPLYLSEDVKSTGELFNHYHPMTNAYIYQHLRKLVPVMAAVNLRGVFVDRSRIADSLAHANDQVEDLLSTLHSQAKIPSSLTEVNWGSNQQVAEILLNSGVPLRERTKTGAYSVKESVLMSLQEQHPVAKTLLQYRAASKLITGFLQPYMGSLTEADPYLHPTLKLTGTATGRLSCANPNLQQVPREGPLKSAFIPRPGMSGYGIVDLEQAELRIAALLSGDEKLAETLNGEDLHRTGAAQVLNKPQEEVTSGERKAFKRVIFGLLYGGTPEGIASKADISVQETVRIIQWIGTNFKSLSTWMRQQRVLAEEKGEIETIFGRRRSVRHLLLEGQRNRVARLSVNTPIQSVASDCMLIVTASLDEMLRKDKLQARILFGVHDSLLSEFGEGEEQQLATRVQRSFERIADSPLGITPLFRYLPLNGTLVLGKSWAAVESTSEGYDPGGSMTVSSLGSQYREHAVSLGRDDDDDVLYEDDDDDDE